MTAIGVIGSGAMGTGIAQVAAAAGENVLLFDADKSALEKAKVNLDSTLKKLAEKGKISSDETKNIFARIHFASDLNEFKSCGLIIEAIVENIEVKQKLFSDLEKIVSSDCVLATNTSSLSITSIASACTKPERVIGIHFFNPAPLMPLVEIVNGVVTDSLIQKDIKVKIESWKKVCVLAKDTPGFIVNRVARPFYGEAIRIYEEGIAGFATIDWAMKEFGGFKMGPFELMDFIGNDVNYTVTETIWKQFFHDPKYKPSLTQKRLFEAKHFGRKSGKGYYDYSPGAVMPEPDKDKSLGEKIFIRVLTMLINEAVDALYYQVATKEDLDLAMTKGVNYPKGLLKWADETGLENVLAELEKLYEEYCEDRYRPSVLLKKMVRENKTFY
ncbi:MAG TPA: 3-hydroxyacyl-CoA dehydrogenase NAD-binding domain-containing protein [Bacteroidia bacterium]|nr:3-hydroxyacyl-CoA dehydrogenase NAD-binding domain-containing protein [Bacteroidia bacterium]